MSPQQSSQSAHPSSSLPLCHRESVSTPFPSSSLDTIPSTSLISWVISLLPLSSQAPSPWHSPTNTRTRYSFSHSWKKYKFTKLLAWPKFPLLPPDVASVLSSQSDFVKKLSAVHPDNGIWLSTKKKWAIKPWKDIKEMEMCISEWKKVYILYDSWRRQWHPTPILLPGKSHGQRSLVGCSPWSR